MAQTTLTQPISIHDNNLKWNNMIPSYSNIYRSEEYAEIMHWLCPLESRKYKHQHLRIDRFDGVGDWFLEAKEFQEWRDSVGGADNAVLFCSGGPGVGKTFLSSLVIDSLCDQAGKEDIAVAGLYCDYINQQEQTATNMMRVVLMQLIGRGDIPGYLREAFQAAKRNFGGRGPQLPDLMEMLRITIASLPQVFICIDALDECLPKHLPEILGSLRDIAQESPNTRIFLTGRPHITDDIRRYFAKAVVIPVSPNADDIRSYLEMRLDRDAEPEAMNDGLRADIVRIILEKASDMFLLVSLHIDAILQEATIPQRRKKLEKITQGNGLSDAYTETLTQLKAQKGYKSILGMKVLMWVLYSERPLGAEELCHALGVELGSTDLHPENVPALRTLLASCLGLVTVETSSLTFRLVHFTLQEHLFSDSALFHSSHSTIAEVCLTYLNFQCVRDLSPTLCFPPATMPLLEYASFYWGEHTKKGMTENVKVLALRLLNKFDEHISAQLILLRHSRTRNILFSFDSEKGPIGFTGLHGTAFLGIAEIFPAVLEMKEWDVNGSDNAWCTPLIWAAIMGHEEVAKLLLKRVDVSPDLEDPIWGRTPLSWAAAQGHDGVVKAFLERACVNPNQASPVYCQTAFYFAAAFGHEGIVKMIFEGWAVNPNQKPTGYFCAPLSIAALNGHERVVKMFLEREDVDPNLADTDDDRTPLSNAAVNGHEGIVKMLLERNDVHIDTRDYKNQTPLSLALSYGHDKIARMICERAAIKSDTADPGSQESLSPSAGHGGESVAEARLSDPPDTNTTDSSGHPHPHQTPTRPVSDYEGFFPDSTNSITPSAELSRPPSSPVTPNFRYSRSKTTTHPNDTPPTLPIAVNQQSAIASFVCILALLLYVLLFLLPNVFSFS